MQTFQACQQVMIHKYYTSQLVEISTGTGDFQAPHDVDAIQLSVSADYRAQNDSLFKTCALHYGCDASVCSNEP